HEVTQTMPDTFILDWRFVLPVVKAKMTDPLATAPSRPGQARSTASFQTNFLNADWDIPREQLQGPPLAVTNPVGFSGHTGFEFVVPENPAMVVPLAPGPEV